MFYFRKKIVDQGGMGSRLRIPSRLIVRISRLEPRVGFFSQEELVDQNPQLELNLFLKHSFSRLSLIISRLENTVSRLSIPPQSTNFSCEKNPTLWNSILVDLAYLLVDYPFHPSRLTFPETKPNSLEHSFSRLNQTVSRLETTISRLPIPPQSTNFS